MASETVLTIRPYPASTKCGHAARETNRLPKKWTPSIFWNCSTDAASNRAGSWIHALLITMSRRPNASIAVSTMALAPSSSATDA